MTTPSQPPDPHDETDEVTRLRKRAEAQLGLSPRPTDDAAKDPAELLHELQVHQVELELQSDELRGAEQELELSRDRYRQLFDEAPVAYLTLGADGRIEEANRAAAELLATPATELVGRPLSQFMTPKDADLLHLHRMDVFSSGQRQRCDLLVRGRDGQPVPVHLDSVQISGLGHAESRCRTVLVDLTPLHQASAALEQSEQRLRRLAEHIDDVLYVREAGDLVYVSPGWNAIWGRRAATTREIGRRWLAAVHIDDRERLIRGLSRLRQAEPLDEVYRVGRPDGTLRWVRDRAQPADGGEFSVGVARDVTSELEVEEELRRAHRMEAVGILASGVAHDFNNLLMGIIGCLRQARGGDLPAHEHDTLLRQAEEAALRGSHLVSRLQVFARDEPVEVEVLDVDPAIESCRRLLEVVLGRANELRIEAGAPDALVLASQVQIDGILLNLAANARDALPGGGRVTLTTDVVDVNGTTASARGLQPSGRCLRLRFDDDGEGMDERTRRHLFEPFFTTKQAGQGTGLGLSTVFEITRRLGGAIDVRSAPGEGATFELLLPLCDDATATASMASPPQPRLSGTVLLVEDEPLVRLVVKHYLEELGLDVLEAAGAAEARRLMEDPGLAIDLLLSDVIMPSCSGPSLANQLHASRPGLQALFMSAHPRAELARRGILGERGALIEKPFTQEALGMALADLLPSDRA